MYAVLTFFKSAITVVIMIFEPSEENIPRALSFSAVVVAAGGW
jgi:hypothetical protein